MANLRVVIQKPVDGTGIGVISFNGRDGVVVPVNGDYTTALVTESTDKNYVTDSEKTVIGNTSNTNTGDETTATIQTKRPLKTVGGESLEGSGNIAIPDSGVQSVTGDGVGGTAENVILSFPNADQVDDSATTNKFATGTNTGDETTATIQTKRPLKTLNSKSLEGTGNETLDGTEIELINNGGVTVTQAVSDLDSLKADQSDLVLTNSQVLNNTTALGLKLDIATNPLYNIKGAVKMSRDTATSTTYISFDGSDVPNVS